MLFQRNMHNWWPLVKSITSTCQVRNFAAAQRRRLASHTTPTQPQPQPQQEQILPNKKSQDTANAAPKTPKLLDMFQVSAEVRHALRRKQPVVALESSILLGDVPLPESVDTLIEIESELRNAGVVPATIVIMNGRIRVGLNLDELKAIGATCRELIVLCGSRDVPYFVTTNGTGLLTPSAAILLSNMIGIRILAASYITGLQRDAEQLGSADLVELAKSPLVVVCSGIKPTYNLERSLWQLNSNGVCVACLDSKRGNFPDYYTNDGGLEAHVKLENTDEAVRLINAWYELGMQNGMLIGTRLPDEFVVDKNLLYDALEEAYADGYRKGYAGPRLNMMMRNAIAPVLSQRSPQCDLQLLRHNALIAASLAYGFWCISGASPVVARNLSLGLPLVVGASILDLSYVADGETKMKFDGGAYPAEMRQTAGGSGRNIAEGLFKLYGDVNLISVIGSDQFGKSLLNKMPPALQAGIFVDEKCATSICSVIFDKKGDCQLKLRNMDIHERITGDYIREQKHLFRHAPLVVMDANLTVNAMEAVLEQAVDHSVPVFYEPTDVDMAGKVFQLPRELTQQIRIMSPSAEELKPIAENILGTEVPWQTEGKIGRGQLLTVIKPVLKAIENLFDCIIVSLNNLGIVICVRQDVIKTPHLLVRTKTKTTKAPGAVANRPSVPREPVRRLMRFYEAPTFAGVVNNCGASDSFCSGFIAALLLKQRLDSCIAMGFVAAKCSMQSPSAVPDYFFNTKQEYQQHFNNIANNLIKFDM